MEVFELKMNGTTIKTFRVETRVGILQMVDKYLEETYGEIKRISYLNSFYLIGWYDYSKGNKFSLDIMQ